MNQEQRESATAIFIEAWVGKFGSTQDAKPISGIQQWQMLDSLRESRSDVDQIFKDASCDDLAAMFIALEATYSRYASVDAMLAKIGVKL